MSAIGIFHVPREASMFARSTPMGIPEPLIAERADGYSSHAFFLPISCFGELDKIYGII